MSEHNQTEPGAGNSQSDLSAALGWLQSMGVLIAALLRLGAAELSLAKEDFGRLILVCLLIVPLFLLTWVALSVLLSWVMFELTLSATAGFATFAAIQLVTSLVLIRQFKTYRHSLTLPATRAQIRSIIEEVRHETSKPSPADRNA